MRLLSLCNYLLLILMLSVSAQVSAIVLSDEEQQYLAQRGPITMCVDPDWMPFEGLDVEGKHVGIAADFLQEIAKIINHPITLVPSSTWTESVVLAKARKCDIMSALNSSPERSKYLNFTEPYLVSAVVIVSRDDVLFIDGLAALNGRKLALPRNYIYEELIKTDYPEIEMVYTDTQTEALQKVSLGQAYAAIGTQITVLRELRQLATQNVKVAGYTEYKNSLRVGVRNDDLLLTSIFAKAIDAIPAKLSNQILQRWYSVKLEKVDNYYIVAGLSIVFLLVLIVVFWRISTIRRFNRLLQDKNSELERISQTDHLTNIYNRMMMERVIDSEISRTERYQSNFSIMLFDIDFFKVINDTHGHHMGDQVLQELAQLISSNIRQTDTLARWGGEEFMLLCPELNLRQSSQFAEKLRQLIESHAFPSGIHLTSSFGVTEYHSGDQLGDLLNRSDSLLYQAKKAGRNRVESSHL